MSDTTQNRLSEALNTIEARLQQKSTPVCLAGRHPQDLHRFAVELVGRLHRGGLSVAVVAPSIERAHEFWRISGHATMAVQSYILERKFNVIDQPDVLVVIQAEELDAVKVPEGLEFVSIKEALLKTSGVVLFTTKVTALVDVADDPVFAETGLTIPHVLA